MPPEVSIVVPSRNRSQLLPRLVAALRAQDYPGTFEVIVVDDASADDTQLVLQRLASEWPALRWVRRERRGGPGRARNTGWRCARAPLIAFTDDDAVADPGWLRALTGALAEADIAQGRVLPDPQQMGGWGAFSHTVAVESENGLYETVNVAYRKEWLTRVGGFDPVFFRAGEDADLAWRAKQAGARTAWVPSAVVRHDVEGSSWLGAVRRAARSGDLVRLCARHPVLGPRLQSDPPSWASRQARVLIASAAVCLALRRRSALLATLPYLRYRLNNAPVGVGLAQRLWLLPAVWSVDLVEALVRFSARLRPYA